jgi:hypothetical protein
LPALDLALCQRIPADHLALLISLAQQEFAELGTELET